MLKNFIVKVYGIKSKNKKVSPGQIAFDDNFKNDFANAFSLCIKKSVIQFDELIGLFNPIEATDDYFFGTYGCCPCQNNLSVINLDYDNFLEQPKLQASTYQTIFYADFMTGILYV